MNDATIGEKIDEQEIRRSQDRIPPLYSQDGSTDPTVYWHYCFPLPLGVNIENMKVRHLLGFQNLFTEYDRKTGDAFGWGILQGDLQNAELGYANVYELERCGMRRDPLWEPCGLSLAKKKVTGYMEEEGSEEHYLWWQHFYMRKIHGAWLDGRLRGEKFDDFSSRLYKKMLEEKGSHE